MNKLENPYVVRFYDSFQAMNSLYIIMEFCENKDLGQFLKRQMGKPLSEKKIWQFFIEMCLGLQYLHANRILHRDIKTINMFLAKDDKIKIGDLGVARELNQTAVMAHTVVGTPYYLSPELCQEKPYNYKSDIWSLGCVLYEMCTYRHPFEAQNQGALILKIVQARFLKIPDYYSKGLSTLVDQMLDKEPRNRPNVEQILKSHVMAEKMRQLGYELPTSESLKIGNSAVQSA